MSYSSDTVRSDINNLYFVSLASSTQETMAFTLCMLCINHTLLLTWWIDYVDVVHCDPERTSRVLFQHLILPGICAGSSGPCYIVFVVFFQCIILPEVAPLNVCTDWIHRKCMMEQSLSQKIAFVSYIQANSPFLCMLEK